MAGDEATTKPGEIHDLADPELLTQLAVARDELMNLRFRHATGQLDNPALIKHARKGVARLSTELRHREIAAHEELSRVSSNEGAEA